VPLSSTARQSAKNSAVVPCGLATLNRERGSFARRRTMSTSTARASRSNSASGMGTRSGMALCVRAALTKDNQGATRWVFRSRQPHIGSRQPCSSGSRHFSHGSRRDDCSSLSGSVHASLTTFDGGSRDNGRMLHPHEGARSERGRPQLRGRGRGRRRAGGPRGPRRGSSVRVVSHRPLVLPSCSMTRRSNRRSRPPSSWPS
jgi:hypothetical protein